MKVFEKKDSSEIENNKLVSEINLLFLGFYKKKSNIDIQFFQDTIYKNFKEELKKILKINKYLKIESINLKEDKLFVDLGDKTLVFDLSKTKDFYVGEKKELEKLENKAPELITQAGDYLYLMDRIFYKNSKEWFGELDEDDILSNNEIESFIESGYKVEGLKKYNSEKVDLKLLQKEFNLIYSDIKKIDKSKLSKEQRDNIISLEKKYFEIIMGIGDNYEGAVGILSRSEKEFEDLLENIINYGTIEESLDYFNWLMVQIDDNNYQSTDVEHSYKLVFTKATHSVFERIKKENAPLSVINIFVKMLRGEGYDIDDTLRTAGLTYIGGKPDFANEVIMYGMNKKEGIFDKIRNSGKFSLEDEKVKDKSPASIIDKLSIQLDNSGNLLKDGIFNNSIYKDLLKSKDKPYSELSELQKSKLSVLYRLSEKIIDEPDKHKTINDLTSSLKEISKEFLEESSEKLEEMINGGYNVFDKDFYVGTVGESFGFTDEENELFEQFKDLHGVGLFDISDNTSETLKGAGNIAAIMGVAVFAPALLAPTATMAIQGAIAGFFAAAASNVIMGKGFNTMEEAIVYIGTDLAMSTGLGYVSGKRLFDANSPFAKWLTTKIPKDVYKNLLIQGVDIIFLGFAIEGLRSMWFENHYYSKGMFSDDNKSEEQKES